MDLDHVCTLHKRWFRNLRIIAQRPDYVEYRLTSLFYGLRQEIKARGAPVDENRYWYEFLAPLAKMRVDGLMEGPDGNLTQIETITFSFHWFLAPLFWMLRPLFNKQKEDILRDDSALLERVCELDRIGFKRLEPALPRVVLYGGDGFFGHLVVEDLLKYSSVEIIFASRHPKSKAFHSSETRVRIVESDVNDYASVLSTIEDAKVVVSCIGPYQGQSLNLLRACIEKHVAYVDVADDRDFVGQSQDNYMLIPLGTFYKEWHTQRDSMTLFIQARNTEMMAASEDEARMFLRAARHLPWEAEDNFGILGSDSIMSLWKEITGNLEAVVVGLTSIFLVVGGIVIMNIMLASVTERTREIG